MWRRSTVSLGLLWVLSACGANSLPQETSPRKSDDVSVQPPNKVDNWERMKDCAQQSGKMLRLGHLEPETRVSNDISVTGNQNHYSLKFGRCYVQVFYLHHVSKADIEKGIPPISYELYDAFEGKLLSSCTDMLRFEESAFCDVEDNSTTCSACREFVKDRMTDAPVKE